MYNFTMNCQFRAEDLDRIYTDAFGPDKKDGTFVEIGASNGKDYSNTCCLADDGWRGVYVEPVATLANACRQNHAKNKVQVFTAAAGRVNANTPLWMIPEWGTATSNAHAAAVISKKPEMFWSSIITLDTILMCAGIDKGFDLLVIDVDFGEIEVLSGFRIKHYQPKLVIIELHDEGQPLSDEIRQFAAPYFEGAGYDKIYKDGINTIFKVRQ